MRQSNIGLYFIACMVLAFFVLLYPLTKPFPYSDDWIYVPLLADNSALTTEWLFALHNDHRIPLQKGVQLVFLFLSGGDYRILLAANVFCLALTSFLWIAFARLLCGKSSATEWLVPALLMSFGFNSLIWGFSFQFISGLTFLSAANYFWARSVYNTPNKLGGLVYVFLTLCGLCGGNGFITSIVVGSGLLLVVFFSGGRLRLGMGGRLAVTFWALVVGLLFSGWRPSDATAQPAPDWATYARFALEMLQAWLGTYAAFETSNILTFLALGFVVLAGIGSFALLLSRAGARTAGKPLFAARLPVVLAAIQTFVVVTAVAFSRAGSQPWWPGLELHYGYLVTPLPLVAWIVLLSLPRSAVQICLLALLQMVVALSLFYNTGWRLKNAREEFGRVTCATADIISAVPAEEVAKEHIRQFYWRDDQTSQSSIAKGISLLRQIGIWKATNNN